MKKVYQTIIDAGKGNCMQAAVASLLELQLEEVPNFKDTNDFWGELFKFLRLHGYSFNGTLYNHRLQAAENFDIWEEKGELPKNRFKYLSEITSVNGFYLATVYSPKFYNPMSVKQITHAVIIDDLFNIVHPVNKEYDGITQFPLFDLIGYNGVINVMMISKD